MRHVNVVLNPFFKTQKENITLMKKTSFGSVCGFFSFWMFRSSWGYRCLSCIFLSPPLPWLHQRRLYILLLLYKSYIPYEAMTEPRSPFLQFCPMVLSIEEIKTTKCGFDSCPFPVSQCFLFRVTWNPWCTKSRPLFLFHRNKVFSRNTNSMQP